MRVLLTNDDGITAPGLQAARRALRELDEVAVDVIAPDSNRSAIGRGITTRRPLWVQEVDFGDGTVGYATDGTPVDCVRFAALGLIDGFTADLIVSGINHGSNLGDDITYSGTVAAALEGIVLGIPAIAISQQSGAKEMDFRFGREFDFSVAALYLTDPLSSQGMVNARLSYATLKSSANPKVRFTPYLETDSPYDDPYTAGVKPARDEWYGRWVTVQPIR